MKAYIQKIESIDSNLALKIGIIFSLLFTALIYFADLYLFNKPE